MRTKREILRRYSIFTIALLFMALGVSLVTRSLTGTSPISSVPYVASVNLPVTMGTGIFILNVILIIGQMLMLGRQGIRKCINELWLQIPVSVLFGFFVDLTMLMLAPLQAVTDVYINRLIIVLAGTICMAFGVALEVTADVAMVSGEYFVSIASRRFNHQFGTVKIMFDVSLVAIAAVMSIAMAGTIDGLREGTLIVALLTGPLVRVFTPHLGSIRRWQTATPLQQNSKLRTHKN